MAYLSALLATIGKGDEPGELASKQGHESRFRTTKRPCDIHLGVGKKGRDIVPA